MNFSVQDPQRPSPLLPVKTRSYRKQLLLIPDHPKESTFPTQMSNKNPFSNLTRHMAVNNSAKFADGLITPGLQATSVPTSVFAWT